MKKLLIADDHEQILDVLKEYARKDHYEVYTAKTGIKALEAFAAQEFDAVLLDVMMPEMDGFEVCRQIRKKSMVPIIMITARGEDFERIMGLDIGADGENNSMIKKMEDSNMKRKVFVWMMAAAATMSLTMPVSAAVSNKTTNTVRYRYVDANGDGICDYFTDKDGDGICDNCNWEGRPGNGCGRYFVDKDGDGICDNYAVRGTGRGAGRGRRGGQGRGRF